MLRARNAARCLIATAVISIAASANAHPADAPKSADSDLPAMSATTQAFTKLRGWIDVLDTPRMNADVSKSTIAGATGVCIVLHRGGKVMGIGTDAAGDDLMLRRAAGLAINQVFSDPALESLSARLFKENAQNPQSALTIDSLRSEIGRTISIELEVSGTMLPLVGRTIGQLAEKLEPGIDGVALRQEQALHVLFPAQLRASNTGGDPGKTLLNIALQSGMAIKTLDELTTRKDLGIYRFRTIDLAQPSPDSPPIELTRGDSLVSPDAVTSESIVEFSDALALHLMNSMWPDPPQIPAADQGAAPQHVERDPLGMMGDYVPVADQYRPLLAPPLDQALAALALERYAQSADLGLNPQQISAAKSTAAKILHELAIVAGGEDDPRDDLAACAAIVLAVTQAPEVIEDHTTANLYHDAAQRVNQSFDPASGFLNRANSSQPPRSVSPHTQAMLAYAMTRLAIAKKTPRSSRDSAKDSAPDPAMDSAPDSARARLALDAAWKSLPQTQQVALLPWIGWAESDFAAATHQPIAHADELRLLIDVLDASILTREQMNQTEAPPDVLGGIALVSDNATGTPRATAQTVRPAGWLASALRDPALIKKRPSGITPLRQLMRFLMQLSVRSENAWQFRNPNRALGGIRAALWDNDQPVPAQALGLMTAVEILRDFRELP